MSITVENQADARRETGTGGSGPLPAAAVRPRSAMPAALIRAAALARPLGRAVTAALVLIGIWQVLIIALRPPAYLLPAPVAVFAVFRDRGGFLLDNAAVTAAEIAIGLAGGALLGILTALVIASFALARRLLLPAVVVTQALPVFAIAPLLVVWLGYGLESKIVMAILIIYFPVASAYADGMARTDPHLIDVAKLSGASSLQMLALIRAPAGLPGLVAGLRVAASVAPIGAVVGEWVGASAGLGYVMLHANARLQTDVLFAALALLAVLTLSLRAAVDALLARLAPWAPVTTPL